MRSKLSGFADAQAARVPHGDPSRKFLTKKPEPAANPPAWHKTRSSRKHDTPFFPRVQPPSSQADYGPLVPQADRSRMLPIARRGQSQRICRACARERQLPLTAFAPTTSPAEVNRGPATMLNRPRPANPNTPERFLAEKSAPSTSTLRTL